MSRPLSCSDPKFNLFNGGLGCSVDGCGQYNKCLTVLNEKFIETTGCCRMKILEPNFMTVFVYILIVPVIGIASLGALGGIYLYDIIYNRRNSKTPISLSYSEF